MSAITHLRSVEITTDDPQSLVTFYEQTWGLRRVSTTEDGEVLLRANGSEHHVLTLAPGTGRSLRRIGLGAGSNEDVDRLAGVLREHGVPLLAGPGARTAPGGGYGVTFADPEGRTVEVSAGLDEHPGRPADDPGPDRLSHVVLNSVSVRQTRDFYTEVLGFRVSDWYEDDQMIFLRSGTVHHCVVLVPGRWTSLNHVAFEVADSDEVMKSLGRMRAAGYDSIWGPGRHGPGGNVFCYFVDPAGNVVEYTAELLEVDDDWQARSWERNAANADVWGTSGGISPAVIAAMSNPPAAPMANPPAEHRA